MENYKLQRAVITCWVFVLVLTLDTIGSSFVEGKQKIPEKYRGLKRKGTVKTIVDPEDEIVIDCVDFYKQHAFDDPLIKSLQADPSLFPSETKITNEDLQKSGLYQNWRKYGECPTGTIPIRRIQNRDIHRKKQRSSYPVHEYAVIEHPYGKFYGGRADLNVWKPDTEPREFSLTQIWLVSGLSPARGKHNTIEAGWIVYPERYHDPRPVTFIYWTKDGYDETGCYDLDCPGFKQTYAGYSIGVPIDNSSIYNNNTAQYDLSVELYHEQNGPNGNWFLNLNGQRIGYWPSGTFDSLTDGADTVHWGGEIVNLRPQSHHTTTKMGSGHFPDESYSRASYVKEIAIMRTDNKWVDVENFNPVASNPLCYGIKPVVSTPEFGTHFYYGGPGYSMNCK